MRIRDWSSDVCSSDLLRYKNQKMQAIAPDFSAVFNNKTAARGDERAGDKLFGSLLREEEAHYAREPQPPREPREAARRDEPETRVDDARRDDPDDAAVDDQHPVEEATADPAPDQQAEEHTSELQSLMRNSYAVIC